MVGNVYGKTKRDRILVGVLLGLLAVALTGSLWAWVGDAGCEACRAARDLIRAPWLLLRGLATRNVELVSMGRGEVAGLVPGIMAGLRNRGVRVARQPSS